MHRSLKHRRDLARDVLHGGTLQDEPGQAVVKLEPQTLLFSPRVSVVALRGSRPMLAQVARPSTRYDAEGLEKVLMTKSPGFWASQGMYPRSS
jgi:hypothetical protein